MLQKLFSPKSIAVIGASRDPGKTGGVIFENLINGGFQGRIFPVNPGYTDIRGVKCYPSVQSIPEDVDLAVVVLRSDLVERAIEDCAYKRIPYVIIVAGGFSETGEEGASLERSILRIARESGIRIIGPNTVGIYLPSVKLNTALTPMDRVNFPGEGSIALISQSGALGLLMMDGMAEIGTGVSAFVNLGNRIDLDESSLLDHFASDQKTNAVMMYIESVSNGRKFYEALHRISEKKPVVVLKSGSTTESARAAMLHTGAMMSDDAVFHGVINQAGAVRARDETELYDFARALAYSRPLLGDRIAVLTTAGGAGVVSTDLLTSNFNGPKMLLATLSEKTRKQIAEFMVPFGSNSNPIDITAEGSVEQYSSILNILVHSGEIDGVLAFALPQTPRMNAGVVDVIEKYSGEIPIVVGVIGSRLARPLLFEFERRKIPAYPSIGRAVSSLKALRTYWKHRGDGHE